MTERKTILVVDDAPENISVLKGVLSGTYLIRPAIHGKAALKAAVVEPLPDLILLDVMMPEMDGYAVCRQLKADSRTHDIPVIFVTGKAQEADELQGLELGAVDYITKPFSPPIVLARVKTHLALRDASLVIESQNQSLREERQVIESIVLRMRSADHLDGRYLRHLFSPVEETAGDLLLSAFTPDGRQLVLLGDFTGHGLTAAIGGPLVAYIFNTFTSQGWQGQAILREINNQLNMRLPVGMFFAACLVEVAAGRRQATVLNAGMPDGLLVKNHAKVQSMPSQWPPLGIRPMGNPGLPGDLLALEPGDRIYLLTDGIIEARSKSGDMFGTHRLEAFLTDGIAGNTSLDALLDQLHAFCETTRHHDDLTLVEILS